LERSSLRFSRGHFAHAGKWLAIFFAELKFYPSTELFLSSFRRPIIEAVDFTFFPLANEESGIMELSLRMRSGEDGEGGGRVPRYICTLRLLPSHWTIHTFVEKM
jgi:hypothetical protein